MIKLIKSTFYKEKETKKKLTKFIMDSEILSFGTECKKFEENFAAYQGRKYCVFFSSGSTANFALFQALVNLNKISRGDSVGFSSVTWSTNVMPLFQLGLKPVPVDVELNTLNVSSRTLAKSSSFKVLFLTNLLGFCDDIDKIAEICRSRKIILLEDNCESLGTVYKGKKLGNYGLASTFSFYVGHHMSTIEGGAVCTDDYELSIMLKLVRAHGWDRNLDEKDQKKIRKLHKIKSPFYGLYTFYDLGNNFRPTEITGFLGNTQLNYIDEIIEIRNKNFKLLAKEIYNNDKYFLPIKYQHIDLLSNFAFPLVCKSEEIKNKLVKKSRKTIELRPIVGGNMTTQPFFSKYSKGDINRYNNPSAEIIHRQGFYLGNNPDMTKDELKTIIDLFK